MSTPIIVWLRHDLRLADNPALYHAAQKGPVIPVFIDDTSSPDGWNTGAASRCWLHHSLESINHQLAGCLKLYQGNPMQVLSQLIQHTGAREVFWNRCYTPQTIRRDSLIKEAFKNAGIEVSSFSGSLLWEPWMVSKADGSPYKVFTPFFRKGCMNAPQPSEPLPRPKLKLLFGEDTPDQLNLTQMQLLPDHSWSKGVTDHWDISEDAAWEHIRRFSDERLAMYQQGRDIPSLNATSYLSPYLQWGQISPRQIWYYMQQQGNRPETDEALDTFLKELGWREFSYYQLYHNPRMTDENLNQRFNHFPWQSEPDLCRAWQQGLTGFPIIDAGMRELWQTGYMHNRVRMLVASFLVKNLRQHWIHGARWFWDTLVDADLASNSASWQWVAGSGTDAAPYFRIFNPVTQGQKFDPEGEYVRRYLPQLEKLPRKYIHTPWEAPEAVLKEAGIVLGTTYPQPMLDLKESRAQALEAFSQLKEQSR